MNLLTKQLSIRWIEEQENQKWIHLLTSFFNEQFCEQLEKMKNYETSELDYFYSYKYRILCYIQNTSIRIGIF